MVFLALASVVASTRSIVSNGNLDPISARCPRPTRRAARPPPRRPPPAAGAPRTPALGCARSRQLHTTMRSRWPVQRRSARSLAPGTAAGTPASVDPTTAIEVRTPAPATNPPCTGPRRAACSDRSGHRSERAAVTSARSVQELHRRSAGAGRAHAARRARPAGGRHGDRSGRRVDGVRRDLVSLISVAAVEQERQHLQNLPSDVLGGELHDVAEAGEPRAGVNDGQGRQRVEVVTSSRPATRGDMELVLSLRAGKPCPSLPRAWSPPGQVH